MTENLAKMVEEYKAAEEQEPTKATTEEVINETVTTDTTPVSGGIALIVFNEWVKKFKDILPETSDVKLLAFKSEDIDGDDNLLFKAPSNKTVGKKEPYTIKGATKIKVPDSKPVFMGFYNNDTFQLRFDISDMVIRKEGDPEPRVIMKTYVAGRNLINVYCIEIEKVSDVVEGEEKVDSKVLLVPYCIETSKKAESINVISPDVQKIFDGIGSTLDSEGLQLMYKPYIKEKDVITTTNAAVEWLLEKQSESIDPAHQLKIDGAIISIIKLAV